MHDLSTRAIATTLRTYCRPVSPGEDALLESWSQVIERSHVEHHRQLWEDAGGDPDDEELDELRQLGLVRQSLVSGRTLWLGGTEYARSRPCCNFNCAWSPLSTVYDLVDVAWLLLNGTGVGFSPQMGTLHGYVWPISNLEIIPSQKGSYEKGEPGNRESCTPDGTWRITLGDSAEAWAKAIGKLFNPRFQKERVTKLILDGSNCRGRGGRLAGYGWICNGPEPMLQAMAAMHEILNARHGNLLNEIDIMDVVNHIGQILSSRRAAEATQVDATNPHVEDYMTAKHEYWIDNPQRRQSNNGVMFWSKPSKKKILELLYYADECGGDPSIVNAEAARNKTPWFQGFNPCYEAHLGAFCNLSTNVLPRFFRQISLMERAIYLIARASYRQTCVDLNDGILQPRWHQTNQALRLCGVSLTGIVQCDWLSDYQIRRLRNAAITGSYSMADELGLPRSKAITCIKPEGTSSKCCDVTEGIHRPLGRYIFNWINFSVHDKIVPLCEAAGYKVMPNPQDSNNMLVRFPVPYDNVKFDKVNGKEVNLESAIYQLDRYLRWNNLWCDQNVSATIYYSPEEIPSIADWVDQNWDRGYIATAFLRRADPTKTAQDLGHPYLPQEVVDYNTFEAYRSQLRPVDFSSLTGYHDLDTEDCAKGSCPVK